MSLLIVPLLYPDLAEYRISQTTFQNNFPFADNTGADQIGKRLRVLVTKYVRRTREGHRTMLANTPRDVQSGVDAWNAIAKMIAVGSNCDIGQVDGSGFVLR
jgi:hypothetical protein